MLKAQTGRAVLGNGAGFPPNHRDNLTWGRGCRNKHLSKAPLLNPLLIPPLLSYLKTLGGGMEGVEARVRGQNIVRSSLEGAWHGGEAWQNISSRQKLSLNLLDLPSKLISSGKGIPNKTCRQLSKATLAWHGRQWDSGVDRAVPSFAKAG